MEKQKIFFVRKLDGTLNFQISVNIGDTLLGFEEFEVDRKGNVTLRSLAHFLNNDPVFSAKYTLDEIKFATAEYKVLLLRDLKSFDFSPRLMNVLEPAFKNIKEILEIIKSKEEFMKYRNAGDKSYNELEEFLISYNFKLGMNLDTLFKKI